jgi:hypothetical protein
MTSVINTRDKTMVLPLKYVAIFLHASLHPATEIYFKNIREPSTNITH